MNEKVNGDFDLKELGMRIRAERERMGLTREQFAEAVGVSAMYIGHIERAQRVMSLKTFVRIAKSLHVSTDYLLFGIREVENKNDGEKEDALIELLNKCTDRERKIAEEILKLLVTYIK
ncbi:MULTISPECIES: helix-turn-helix domain-containing protein [Thermoanaerobacterium]|uniref:Helix-turn-helix domain-containing protein n=2 Tax=Thermoanaerobacterium TaxID=28895 RepID=W9EDY1_9THEO|nr:MULTISPECIES: helix-turn-helix transcriptional regulator [Thermoanaerobacterium]AFK85463.1 helix-turn-helix domain protein [Thermoanaerobacterium saccharolyticum JW/SL-YS485]ETO39421.1 helix-turn-helix domain-containing protein [Thermoanaerobacterium aotearoense SCUT27]